MAAQALAEAIERVALVGKTLGSAIGPVPESVQEVSVVAIVLGMGQLAAEQVAESAQCRQTVAVPQTASVIGLSHQAPDSVQVEMLLVAVGLTEAPLAQQVTAEVPAWEALDSAVVVAEGAHVLEEAHEAEEEDVVDDKRSAKDEILFKY